MYVSNGSNKRCLSVDLTLCAFMEFCIVPVLQGQKM